MDISNLVTLKLMLKDISMHYYPWVINSYMLPVHCSLAYSMKLMFLNLKKYLKKT